VASHGPSSIAKRNYTVSRHGRGGLEHRVAGLTLGGGLGWLMGKYGLALDNLRSVELVTAEGKVLASNKDEAPDLFWPFAVAEATSVW